MGAARCGDLGERSKADDPVPPQNPVDRTIVDVSTLGVNLTYPHASVALRAFRNHPTVPSSNPSLVQSTLSSRRFQMPPMLCSAPLGFSKPGAPSPASRPPLSQPSASGAVTPVADAPVASR